LEAVFRQYYQVDKKPTLVIVALMLGVWVCGEKVSWILRQMAMNNNYPLTIITPGSNAEEIIEIVGRFSEIIISGLEEQNTDFRALKKVIGEKARLEIKLYSYQNPEISQGEKVKHNYT
jgi:hypothetical protein